MNYIDTWLDQRKQFIARYGWYPGVTVMRAGSTDRVAIMPTEALKEWAPYWVTLGSAIGRDGRLRDAVRTAAIDGDVLRSDSALKIWDETNAIATAANASSVVAHAQAQNTFARALGESFEELPRTLAGAVNVGAQGAGAALAGFLGGLSLQSLLLLGVLGYLYIAHVRK